MPTPDVSRIRRQIQELLEEDLAAALAALKDLLPEGTDKHDAVLSLRARLNDANKEKIRNTIAPDEYGRRIDTIRANLLDLLRELTGADFEPPAAEPAAPAPSGRQGSVLYRVPHRMRRQKPSICTVRVALDEEAILDDIVLDDDVRLRPRVEVSDMMRAELLDPAGGEVFAVRPLSEPEQLVREQGYTQWLFSVTPRLDGEHQLLVKVSMMEYNPHLGRYVPREVSILETVTIVTDPVEIEDAPLKATGESFALGPEAPRAAAPQSSAAPQPKTKTQRPKTRMLALFLAFLLIGSGTIWATPRPTRDWWLASLRDSAEAYAEYIKTYKDQPGNAYVERAYYYKADKTNALADFRAYQAEYGDGGRYGLQVLERIANLELKAVESLRRQPTLDMLQQFEQDFPSSQYLPELRRVVQEGGTEGQKTMESSLETETPGDKKETSPRDTAISPTPGDTRPRRSGLDMAPVPGGTFTMGCKDGRDGECYRYEYPAHTVTVPGFEIGRYEVTQADWRAVMGDNPSHFKGCDECPVESVSWNDIQDFLKKLNAKYPGKNYRLPTEAEWEYAARGGRNGKGYRYSGGNNPDEVAWHDGNSGSKTHPVGTRKANELDLYDMSGNVYEWVADDWHDNYDGAPQNGRAWIDWGGRGSLRVGRGGSWLGGARLCRAAYRGYWRPGGRLNNLGFRVASSPQ